MMLLSGRESGYFDPMQQPVLVLGIVNQLVERLAVRHREMQQGGIPGFLLPLVGGLDDPMLSPAPVEPDRFDLLTRRENSCRPDKLSDPFHH